MFSYHYSISHRMSRKSRAAESAVNSKATSQMNNSDDDMLLTDETYS
jgi:hypothetical protein